MISTEPQPVAAAWSPRHVDTFRSNLMAWYRLNARKLPWRGVDDPYRIWVSEVMLQQTRVAAVIEHYHRFLDKFPTVSALATAPEADVLAAWSGLGYYRRARMMHRASKFIMEQLGGVIPQRSTELRALPGIGDYTSAAIASIAFGESIAVLDGNVERVLLRLTGRPEDTTTAGKTFLRQLAATLVPPVAAGTNAPGDHNQAMMELGATLCLPRAPLCLHCPVRPLCATQGEHRTQGRAKAKSRPAAYLLTTRGEGSGAGILLELRSADASLMPGMYELPPLPLDALAGREPTLRLRHAITNTLYSVEIYIPGTTETDSLLESIPASAETLHWHPAESLHQLPLTGLTRKVLHKLNLMS